MRAEDLSVIIPTRGRPDILKRTLEALEAQTVRGFELVLVVDGDDQPTPVVPGATVITQQHRGPGAARNRGVAATTRPIVVFLGDDMIPEADLLARHIDAHTRRSRVQDAILGCVRWHPAVSRNHIVRWMDRSGFQFDTEGLESPDVDPGWGRFTTGNVSLKREMFERAGGFDEDFFFLFEDIELGLRLANCGMRLWYEPLARCLHFHSYDLEGYRNRMVAIGKSERLMTIKHPWFEPTFRSQVVQAMGETRALRIWPRLVDFVPPRPGRVRDWVEAAANRWYLQHGAPALFENWEGEQDLEELRQYLGDSFDEEMLAHHKEAIALERQTSNDESTFYRTSQVYLYELTMFGRWQVKTPYLMDVMRLQPAPARVLDYGSGIGTDGLRMQHLGYDVAFADFDNPCSRYLRWRLARRGIEAPVYDVEQEVPGGHDVVLCFDVIEHVEDPWGFLARLESLGSLVVVNLLEPEPEDDPNDLHRPLPIKAIVDHAASRGLVRYRLYHGRSHLLAYRGTGPPTSKMTSHLQHSLGKTLSRLEGLPN